MKLNSYASVIEIILSWFVFLFFIIALLYRDSNIWDSAVYQLEYFDILISDWLINYAGGFVRRGIMGQFLLCLEQVYLFDLRLLIIFIVTLSSVILVFLLCRLFLKQGWPFLLIPTGLLLGYTAFNLFGRRDLLSLLITFFIFYTYKKVRTGKERKYLILFYIVGIIQILLHEASFFYTFPILMLDTWMMTQQHNTFEKSLCSCLLLFSPILAVMMLVSFFHGNQEIADSIWASWKDVFAAFPDGTDNKVVGSGIQYLISDLLHAAKYHLSVAYKGGLNPEYWRALLVLFNYISVYYLITRINTVNMGINRHKGMNHILMSNIFVTQYISMTPMFTILSCDWGRTIPYLVITTLFFYSLFCDLNVECPSYFNKFSLKAQRVIDSNRLFRSPFFYLLIVLITPIPSFDAPDFTDRGHNTFQYLFVYIVSSILS